MNVTRIYNTKEDFDKRENKEENGVSPKFAKDNSNWETMNDTNKGCWDCNNCTECAECIECYDCHYCTKFNNANHCT